MHRSPSQLPRQPRFITTVFALAFAALIGWTEKAIPQEEAMAAGAANKDETIQPAEATVEKRDLSNDSVQKMLWLLAQSGFPLNSDRITVDATGNAKRIAYFGDLHVHTTYSFDAFAFGTLATPYDAYRYAQGEAILHPAGFKLQLRQPLDFYAVADHAMYLGVPKVAADTSSEFSKLDLSQQLHNLNSPENMNVASSGKRISAIMTFLAQAVSGVISGDMDTGITDAITRDAWQDIIRAAEQFNEPGKFTTFVAYEYTSITDDGGNLHRNVIFRGADRLPAIPFSRFHSQNPEGLWHWMDSLREEGIESLAIPHNSNQSNGQMFKLVDWAGNPMDDTYAEMRMRNEPLVESTQIKGTSETHPALSFNDEWADFEIAPNRAGSTLPSDPNGSYVRQAYLRGLTMQDAGIENPYKFGMIGSSDTHIAATTDDEANYFSKLGLFDSDSQARGTVPVPEKVVESFSDARRARLKKVDNKSYISTAYETWGASGLAGVWAEENTREAIFDALRRRETFATSGPRIRVRFFGGYGFDDSMLGAPDMVTRAYSEGVSMGSDLLANGNVAPSFILWAIRDPLSAGLQRLQIIKGWTIDGKHHEKVYDSACSDGGAVDPDTHRCPDNGASVDLTNCSISTAVGDAQLMTVWTDPDFNPNLHAFYYIRVLENPSCRWSTWDALRAGFAPRSDLEATIQERAWSSPIWFVPERK